MGLRRVAEVRLHRELRRETRLWHEEESKLSEEHEVRERLSISQVMCYSFCKIIKSCSIAIKSRRGRSTSLQ